MPANQSRPSAPKGASPEVLDHGDDAIRASSAPHAMACGPPPE